jgi:hypothetical protein
MSLTSLLLVSLTAGSIFTYNVVIITFLAELFINNFIEGSRYKEKGRTTTGDMARGEITGDPVPAVLAAVLTGALAVDMYQTAVCTHSSSGQVVPPPRPP